MKRRTPKLLVSFFILAIILIIAVPSTGFAAKTTVSTVKAKNAKKQSKNVTVKYRKQMNRILEATQLYYSIRLNYSMQSGETKKIKLTSLEKQNVAAGRQVLEGQSRITNFAFSQRVKELFGANARIASLSFKTYPETPKELVVRCNSNYVKQRRKERPLLCRRRHPLDWRSGRSRGEGRRDLYGPPARGLHPGISCQRGPHGTEAGGLCQLQPRHPRPRPCHPDKAGL